MTPRDIAALLNYAAKLDSRVARDLAGDEQAARTIATWVEVVGDIPTQAPAVGWDAAAAVRRYYEDGDAARFWAIQPHHLTAAWAPYRRELMGRHVDPVPAEPRGLDDDVDDAEYRGRLAANRRAVLGGQTAPAVVPRAIESGEQARVAEYTNRVGRQLCEAARVKPHRPAFPEYAVACPASTCGAAPGKACRSASGTELRKGTHGSRRDAYAAHAGAAR